MLDEMMAILQCTKNSAYIWDVPTKKVHIQHSKAVAKEKLVSYIINLQLLFYLPL